MTERILLAVLPRLGYWFIRFLYLTMRLTYVNFDSYRKIVSEGPVIMAFWHGRLLMMPYGWPGRDLTVLVSAHRDGELIARTVKGFSINAERGSTTRGWFSGLKGLLKTAKRGGSIAITPDGPRGPRQKARMGAVMLAERTGLPIVPVSFGADKKKTFRVGMAFSYHILSAAAYS
jgi:lysophospholipid acyltransferase (LPLAT)-like uncharacterized protein